MGGRLFFIVVLMWVIICLVPALTTTTNAQKAHTICDVRGCNCTKKAAPWKVVNCSLTSAQDVHLDPKFVPEETMEIFISGGNSMTISSHSIHLLNLALLRIDGTKHIVMEKQSFYDIISASLLIQIQNCDQLTIKTGAFENKDTSIESDISHCGVVAIEKSAFDRLYSAKFKDIPKLSLSANTFEFKNQATTGKHGPVTTISFDNVIIPRIPHQTFFSSLAEINIKNSEIHEVYNEAFRANQISAISMINSTINFIRSGAFIGRTLIFDLRISKCRINKLESKAITAGIGNLTVQHSRIADIEEGAINSTVVNIEIVGNEIVIIHSNGLIFQNWLKINIDQNVMKDMRTNFLVAPSNPNVQQFTFNGNEVHKVQPGAFSFVPELDDKQFNFENNFFEQTCHCYLDEWAIGLITVNQTTKITHMLNNTFCRVNDLLTQCFNLTADIINIKNFTKLVCNNNKIICESYNGETKFVNTTSKMLANNNQPDAISWLTIIVISASLIMLAIIGTFVVLLIKGSRWLKRKGYFRKIQYNQNEPSNDEENTIVTVDENESDNDKIVEVPDELTIEYLQELSKQLDDPNTHQQASEMIERLYEMFVVDDSYENNNRQDEESHLYEELGNLQQQHQQPPEQQQQDQTRSILRLMEEKISSLNDNNDGELRAPKLVGDYSEPSDAAVHLYSELRQNKDNEANDGNNCDSLKSKCSTMAFRPLPDKPGPSKL